MTLLAYHPPLSPYLTVVYQDDAIVVLDKPSGLLTVPGKAAEHQDSLQVRVQRVWPTARIVHRLDMATSGIVIMALTPESHRHLNWQFERRQTAKHYIALLEGELSDSAGTIDLPLICDWPNRPKQMVSFQYGKVACTRYQRLAVSAGQSRVQLTPVTGRSHQLRVHMQWLGHPIIGDKFYGSAAGLAQSPRLLLHAAQLTVTHPVTDIRMTFQSDVPF